MRQTFMAKWSKIIDTAFKLVLILYFSLSVYTFVHSLPGHIIMFLRSDPDNTYFKRSNIIKRGARKFLSNAHGVFCSINLVQVPNTIKYNKIIVWVCLCCLVEPSSTLHISYKPAVLMNELKIYFWCVSSAGFRGLF